MLSLLTFVLAAATVGPCTFEPSHVAWEACAMPPQECPNGPFTSAEACSRGLSSPGCPARRTVRGNNVGFNTDTTEVFVDCGIRFHTFVSRCQCSGNLFGFCMGPCRPVGGLQALLTCPGQFSITNTCQPETTN